jgi:hypothetical protein
MGARQRQASGCSEAQISMGFHPMGPQQRGKIILLTFEWRWATVAAGNRESVWPRREHDEGNLQCLLNDTDISYVGGRPP